MNNPPVTIRVRRFREGATLPTQGTTLAAGRDIYAWLPDGARSLTLQAGERATVKTGLNLRFPAGYEVQIRPRSGLAHKAGITIVNSPGTIDADFDGDGEKFELGIIMLNTGTEPFVVQHGDRIAQMVLNAVPDSVLVEDFEDNSNRNESQRAGGLGHTGV